jgi:hypothetical protein
LGRERNQRPPLGNGRKTRGICSANRPARPETTGRAGLKPHIDEVFALRDIAAGLDRLESSRQFGKIGLAIGAGGR